MTKLLLTYIAIFWTFEISAQKIKPYSFQDFRLGMTLESFKKLYPQSKSGLYYGECESVKLYEKEIPRLKNLISEIEPITYLYFSLIKKTESGDKIYVTLGFYEGKVGLIKVIYTKPQVLSEFIEALRDKYGKEEFMKESDPIPKLSPSNQKWVSYGWKNLNYEIYFSFNKSLDCKMNSTLTFTDTKTEKAIRNDNLKKNKKRVE